MNVQQLEKYIRNISSKYNIPEQELNDLKNELSCYKCPCGSILKNKSKSKIEKHQKSNKHIKFVSESECESDTSFDSEYDSNTDTDVKKQKKFESLYSSLPKDIKKHINKYIRETEENNTCELCFNKVSKLCRRKIVAFPWGEFDSYCKNCEKDFVYMEEVDSYYYRSKGKYLLEYEYMPYKTANLLYGLHPSKHISEETSKDEMINIMENYGLLFVIDNMRVMDKDVLYNKIKNLDIEPNKIYVKKTYKH